MRLRPPGSQCNRALGLPPFLTCPRSATHPPLLHSSDSPPSQNFSPWLDRLTTQRVVAVLRSPSVELGWAMAEAALAGGITCLEVAWTSDRPADLLARLRSAYPDRCLGAGTILSMAHLQEAIAAGAQFCFSPVTDPALIQRSSHQGIPFIPGALTPTEIVHGWSAGAPCIKVFPINTLGGATYLRSLSGPLGQIPLIPTGGVTRENMAELLTAGAIAVGLASSLFADPWVRDRNWPAIQDYAATVVAIGQGFRGSGQSRGSPRPTPALGSCAPTGPAPSDWDPEPETVDPGGQTDDGDRCE